MCPHITFSSTSKQHTTQLIASSYGRSCTRTRTFFRSRAEARRIGLLINASKTKYMRARGSNDKNSSLPPRVIVDGDELEVMYLVVVYWRSLVTADNNTSNEIQRRIQSGNRPYFALRKTLRSNRVRHRTKLKLYITLIIT